MGYIEEHCAVDENSVVYTIEHIDDRCIGCGLCEAFCPVDVFEMSGSAAVSQPGEPSGLRPVIVHEERCCGCETCTGQCPRHALRISGTGGTDVFENRPKADPLPASEAALYREWSAVLKDVLALTSEPVAVSLIPAGAPIPDVPVPSGRLRYCQSLVLARLGRSIMLPPNRHACPDGTSILGMTSVPAKLQSGELYVLFHKLETMEAAQQMVGERPHLPERSIDATVVTPLAQAACTPDVVAIIGQPEQMMWLCMSASYYTGTRFDFHVSGYNSQCVETTLYPYLTGKMNISLGCYGCRAASDMGTDLMFMGVPRDQMPQVIKGLRELGKKAIPESRAKVYLPPL